MDIINRVENWNKVRGLDLLPFNRTSETKMLLEELLELNGIENSGMLDSLVAQITAGPPVPEDEKVDALCDIIVVAIGSLIKLGYDPTLAMDETIKEIDSRTGALDKTSGKFIKDTSQEAMSLRYTAQYGNALR